MLRDHAAGSLRSSDDGATVVLAGWVARRRDHGGVIFIDLRDASGVVQVVFREGEMASGAHRLRSEFCIQVTGTVGPAADRQREPRTCRPVRSRSTATGLEVLSESAALPFPIESGDPGRRGGAAAIPLPGPAPLRAGSGAAAAIRGQPGCPNRAGCPGLRRDRDAHPDQVDPGGRPRLPGAGPSAARLLVRAAAVAATVQAVARWWPAWSATTRSPAAIATRTSAPTGSRSSPSSTSRCPSSTQDDIIAHGRGRGRRPVGAGRATTSSGRSRGWHSGRPWTATAPTSPTSGSGSKSPN